MTNKLLSVKDVSKQLRAHSYQLQRGRRSKWLSLKPGFEWSYKVLFNYPEQYKRPPEAVAKTIFTLVRLYNQVLLKNKYKAFTYHKGADYAIDWLCELQRKERAKWEKMNPEKIERLT